VVEEIEVMEMIFSDEALQVSKYAQMSLEHQLQHYRHLPLAGEYEEQGRFFSNEFARSDIRPGEDHKYKITSAYASPLINCYNILVVYLDDNFLADPF
jgi:hypothetical protein